MPGRWKWLTPLNLNELERASAFHASGIAAIEASTTAFPFSSSNSLYRVSVRYACFPFPNSHEIDSPVNNVLHCDTEFLENGHDVGPDDLRLLAVISFTACSKVTSGGMRCPLGRNIGERCVGRDDGYVVEEVPVRWRACLGVEVLERRHIDCRTGDLRLRCYLSLMEAGM
jgi:hypothetical protein